MREEIIKMGYKKLSSTNEEKAIERARKFACCLKDYKTLIEEAKIEQKVLVQKESEYLDSETKSKGEEGILEGRTNLCWDHTHQTHKEGEIVIQSAVCLPFEKEEYPIIGN